VINNFVNFPFADNRLIDWNAMNILPINVGWNVYNCRASASQKTKAGHEVLFGKIILFMT